MSKQFEAQIKAIKFQEIYYPCERKMKQKEQSEAICFAFSQGYEMATRAMQKRVKELEEELENKNSKM